MRRIITTLLLLCATVATITAQQTQQTQQTQQAQQPKERTNINAHGGCIIEHDGQWLWYGESRPERGFTSLGVSLYTAPKGEKLPSMDEWENKGLVFKVVDEAGSPIERGCIIERPKVLWNERDQRFVMLFHLELKGKGYAAAMTGFATSETPTGPFTFHHAQRPNAGLWPADFTPADIAKAENLNEKDYAEWWTPEWRKAVEEGLFVQRDRAAGQMSRDMTVFVDDDGSAWHIYSSEENMTIQFAELTPDYLGYTGRYYRVAAGGQNEAPTILKRDGRYWMICSGCTGWDPNEARMFTATNLTGPWTQLPSPMRGRGARRTFGGQGTWIFQPTPTTYYFMADIWRPRSLAHSGHLCLPIQFQADGTPIINGPER